MRSIKYLIIASALIPCPAIAGEFFFKPYAGADYQYTKVNYENNIDGTGISGDDLLNDTFHGANFHLGARIHRNLGFEVGYLWTAHADKNNILGTNINTETNVSGINLDALGYIPINERAELIGTVGISRLKVESKLSTPGLTNSINDSEINGRIGTGAQYWLTDNINLRGIVRYQGADFDNAAKNAIIGNLGINFQF